VLKCVVGCFNLLSKRFFIAIRRPALYDESSFSNCRARRTRY